MSDSEKLTPEQIKIKIEACQNLADTHKSGRMQEHFKRRVGYWNEQLATAEKRRPKRRS